MSFRAWTYRQLDPRAWPGMGLSPINMAVTALIFLALLVAILETEPVLAGAYGAAFQRLELAFGAAFAVEYGARIWSCAEAPGGSPLRNRLRFFFSPAGMIDLLVLVITVVPAVATTLMPLRLVRVFRILRLAKLGRTSSAFRHIAWAVRSRARELALTAMFALGLLVLGATALHLLEGGVQPDSFGSIPRAMWWAVVTLTTIGYGDVYPVTPFGKIVASGVAFTGIGLIAMPAGILAAAFSEAYRRDHEAE